MGKWVLQTGTVGGDRGDFHLTCYPARPWSQPGPGWAVGSQYEWGRPTVQRGRGSFPVVASVPIHTPSPPTGALEHG